MYIVRSREIGGVHHVPGRPTSWHGRLELELEEKKVFAERKLDMYFNVNIDSVI